MEKMLDGGGPKPRWIVVIESDTKTVNFMFDRGSGCLVVTRKIL